MGKPIVTTNVPGCKETVIDAKNGFLCKVKSPEDLADKMESMLQITAPELQQMGQASRELALIKFDEKLVINRYLQAINSITASRVS